MIFIDLEFTDLKNTASLISAGFVDADGNTLYVEVEQNYWIAEASDFVKQTVIPLLTGPAYTPDQATAKIIGWMNARGPEITLISDSDWDRKILKSHLRQSGYRHTPTWHWIKAPMHLAPLQRKEFSSSYAAWFLRTGKQQHHALNDAIALADATFRAVQSN